MTERPSLSVLQIQDPEHLVPIVYYILVFTFFKQPLSLTCLVIGFISYFSYLLQTQQCYSGTRNLHKVSVLSYILSLCTKNGECQKTGYQDIPITSKNPCHYSQYREKGSEQPHTLAIWPRPTTVTQPYLIFSILLCVRKTRKYPIHMETKWICTQSI